MTTILYVLLALLLLGIMITVHELGHFCAAHLCGVAVRAFGIGFGPKIITWKGRKSGTEYSLRAIPCGGFCAFFGEDDTEGTQAKEDPRSMMLQPAWKRLVTIAMGPLMNFVLAFAAALCFFSAYGLPYAGSEVTTVIVSTEEGSPAQAAGLLPGDVITHVDDAPVKGDIVELIRSWQGNAPLHLTVVRGKETLVLPMTPTYIATEDLYRIGVTMELVSDTVWKHAPFGATLSRTWDTCVMGGSAVLNALKNLVLSGEGMDQMAGPVGVIRIIAEETRQYKLMGYLNMLVMLSINLGLVNLLPIPGLDGCRILFVLFEMIARRPINRKVEAYIHLGGYLLLIVLMLCFTFRDVLGIFR